MPTISGRSPRAARRRSAWPRCTRPFRSASAATGCPSHPTSRPACWPRWVAACRRATAASSVDHYATLVAEVRDDLLNQADEVVEALSARMDRLADDRALRGGRRAPRPALRVRPGGFAHPAARCALLVRRAGGGAPRGRPPVGRPRRTQRSAGCVGRDPTRRPRRGVGDASCGSPPRASVGGPGPTPAASAEESEQILRWLEQPGVRLVHVEGEWTCPIRGATRHLAVHDAVERVADHRWCPSTNAARWRRSTSRRDEPRAAIR